MKKLLIFLLIGVAAAGAAYWFFSAGEDKKQEELVIYGNVDIREVGLAFNVSERIVEILVEEGQPVHRGQLLARLRPITYELAVKQAEARRAAQEDAVKKLEAGTRKEDIELARAQVQRARVEAKDAMRSFLRNRALLVESAVSQERADNLRARAEAAEAGLRAAEAELQRALEGPRKEDIAASKSQLRALEEELAVQRQRLEDTRLHAPVDGVVRNRIRQPGDMAFPEAPVFTLALTNPVWIRTYVSETDLGKIFPGMKAFVKTDSFPDRPYEGWVGYISPVAEFTPKTVQTPEIRTHLVYQVRVYVCNPRNELRLGLPVTVRIPLSQPQSPGPLPNCGEE
jgi:HlyD family secretion protein